MVLYIHTKLTLANAVSAMFVNGPRIRIKTVPRLLVSPALAVCGWCKLTPILKSHNYLGHMILIGPQLCKWVKFYIFSLSYKLTSHHELWPSVVTYDIMNMWRFLHYINKPSKSLVLVDLNFSTEVNFTFCAHLTTWPQMIFNLVLRSLT